VLILARLARRVFRSNMWGTVVGLLMALDGLAIVMSRTALLDNALMLFVLMAFAALLVDRDQLRTKVSHEIPAGWYPGTPWIPQISGVRPWRIVAAASLGAACAVKWSGVWFLVAFGLLTVLWDLNLRRSLAVSFPWRRSFVSAVPTALMWVGVAAAVYVVSWAGWFLTDDGYFRQWAVDRSSSFGFIPDALRSWWHYHAEALRFHTTLTSEHSYAANAFGWPLQARPTAFFYDDEVACGADNCSQAVLALGNPVLWWTGALALIHQTWRALARHDWVSGAIVVGYLAGWAPWLLYQDRPIFAFYGIVLLPFLLLALGYSAKLLLAASGLTRQHQAAVMAFGMAVVVAVSWFFYPIWVGEPIPYTQWQLRMWLPSWV
jgi:dolichyl-phosphate-mannose-protein mannosyltransferase